MGDLEASQPKPAQEWHGQDSLDQLNEGSFEFEDGNDTAPTSLGTSPDVRSHDATQKEAQVSSALKAFGDGFNRFSTLGNGKSCESCTMSLPEDTSKRLPVGAPGSPRPDGIGLNGSPILRSRELLQIVDDQDSDSETEEEPTLQHSSPESFTSDTSSFTHKHTLTYISTSSPLDPNTYSVVRRAIIRTLSCEQLPRGITAGELSFGDPVNGYTIAYKFRLSDPHARGGHRKYALLALACNERRARQATTFIWNRFQHIAADIIARTDQNNQRSRSPRDTSEEGPKSNMLPISSFLTGRMTDPDGYPRNGGTRPKARGLPDMVGDEKLFAELHLEFIALLRDLRWRFGE